MKIVKFLILLMILFIVSIVIYKKYNLKDECNYEFKLQDYYDSNDKDVTAYYVYIKNYDEGCFNYIPFEKYIKQFKEELKNEIPEKKYFHSIVFVKSDRYFNVENFDNVSYKDYKKDIIIDYIFDIEEQKKRNKLKINQVNYYANGNKKIIYLSDF